jgi:hypothetical protein
MQENDIKNEIKQKELEIIKELTRLEESSLNSTLLLQKQGEQLNKMQKDVQVINENLTVSEKIVKGMRGFVSFLFTGTKKAEQTIEKNKDKFDLNKEQIKEQIIEKTYVKTQEQNKEKEQNKEITNLDIMSNNLEKIKQNVYEQKNILDVQNKTLDKINDEADKANQRIKKLNRNIKKI